MQDDIHTTCDGLMQQARPCAAQRWFVYLVECADGTFYTGCTTDVKRRLLEHNGSSRGARYTRSRRPVRLICCRELGSRSEAQREEARIKHLTRDQKRALVATWENQ